MSDIDQAKMIVNRITTAMQAQQREDGRPLRWFYVFGTMLEYCADRTFHLNYDIDIGVFFHEYNPKTMRAAWEDAGYRHTSEIVHDKTGRPLNMHFEPIEQRLRGSPTIDIYCFAKSKGEYVYTYDYNKEGKRIPSKYVFKRIDRELIEPPKATIEAIRHRSHPESRLLLDADGIWHYDVFEDHGPYKVQMPFAYGTLCDKWYPGWRFRQYYKGQSVSVSLISTSTCEGVV